MVRVRMTKVRKWTTPWSMGRPRSVMKRRKRHYRQLNALAGVREQ